MASESERRVLIVAFRSAAAPELIEAVRDRAAKGPCSFTLLVPTGGNPLLSREMRLTQVAYVAAQEALEEGLPRLSEAAGSPVEGMVSDLDPVQATRDAVDLHEYDEIIIAVLPPRLSRWLPLHVPDRIKGLRIPVTTVLVAEQPEAAPRQ